MLGSSLSRVTLYSSLNLRQFRYFTESLQSACQTPHTLSTAPWARSQHHFILLIVWPTQWDKSSPRGYHPPFAGITLLLVSRAISEEAISVMCKKSVFVLDLDYYVFDMTQRPSQHIMNRMLNVDIKFNLSIFRELAARNDGSALAIWKHCLEGLAGSHLHRDVCQITITCSIPKQPDITTSPFFQVFKRFLEFRIVSFMFICPPKSFSWNINRNDCFGGYHPRTRQTGHWMEVAPEHRSR